MVKNDTELEDGQAYTAYHQQLGEMTIRVTAISPSHVQCHMLPEPKTHKPPSFSLDRDRCVFEPLLYWNDRPSERG